MEYYETLFYISVLSAITLFVIFGFCLQKIRKKANKSLIGYLTVYVATSIVGICLYASTSYISWRIPWEVYYQTQCILFALVFSFNALGTILIGLFINEIFFKMNKQFTLYLTIVGISIASLFLIGGIMGFSHEPKGENNNDLKFEYYVLYNLFYLPIILLGLVKTVQLLRKPDIDAIYRQRLKYIAIFFTLLMSIFIFAILDLIGDSPIFAQLSIGVIPVALLFTYLGFFTKINE